MSRHKRLHKREKKCRNKVIVMSLFGLVLLLSCGYAAFQTSISINAKGIIKKTAEECFTVVDNGDGTGTITDYNESCGTKVVIPNTINNLTITKINSAEYDSTTTSWSKSFTNKGITMLELPDTIIEIGDAAFNINKISNLSIPSSVKKIGESAFRHNKIKSLTLPDGYIDFGRGPFNDNLLTGDNAFIYKRNTDGTIDYTTLISYAGMALNVITVPSNVTIIEEWAFRSLSQDGFDTLIIPDTVTKINGEICSYTGFKNIIVGNGITEVSSYAFSYNSYLETITFGNSVSFIGESALSNNDNLVTININRKENMISGSPWGATNATINWTGAE